MDCWFQQAILTGKPTFFCTALPIRTSFIYFDEIYEIEVEKIPTLQELCFRSVIQHSSLYKEDLTFIRQNMDHALSRPEVLDLETKFVHRHSLSRGLMKVVPNTDRLYSPGHDPCSVE